MPKTEWPIAAAEPATVGGLYASYIAIIAALPVIAGIIKSTLIGYSFLGVTVRAPIGSGMTGMVLQYALSLVLVYVMALIINALALSFGGQKDMVQSLKTVAYAWTASWIAGIAVIVPWLGMLVVIAGGICSIHLLYLGLPHTMKCPPDKAGGYTAVSIVIAIVLSWIVGLIVAAVIGTAYWVAPRSGRCRSAATAAMRSRWMATARLAGLPPWASGPNRPARSWKPRSSPVTPRRNPLRWAR